MDKKTDHIQVYGTKEGKLFIKPSELFSQERVKLLIDKIANSSSLKEKAKKAYSK